MLYPPLPVTWMLCGSSASARLVKINVLLPTGTVVDADRRIFDDGNAGVDGPGEGADGGAGNAKLDFDSVRQFDGLKSVSESVWGCHAQAS